MSVFHSSDNSLSFGRAASSRPTDDYFDIDDIIAGDLKVPCKFELPVYRLGFLNKGSEKEHIEVGVSMELPVWLAAVLNSRRRHIVSVELPKIYKESYREIVKADANAVDLYKLGPYYYSAGMKLLQLDHPETEQLSTSLLEVCMFSLCFTIRMVPPCSFVTLILYSPSQCISEHLFGSKIKC